MQDYREFMAEQASLGTSKLETAARWWDLLADDEQHLAAIGLAEQSVAASWASTYRRTAESLRIEERTGVAVCACCYKPFGSKEQIENMKFSDSWDLSSIPDYAISGEMLRRPELLKSIWARRNSAKRKKRAGGRKVTSTSEAARKQREYRRRRRAEGKDK